MLNEFSRTQLLLGPEAMETLAHSRVAVFGIGGVGGYAVEALARSGIGALDLIDDDKVCLTNINRQVLATRKRSENTRWTWQPSGLGKSIRAVMSEPIRPSICRRRQRNLISANMIT